VLGRVVARAEHERGIDLRVRVEEVGHLALDALGAAGARRRERAEVVDYGFVLPRRGALARVGQPRRARGPRVDGGEQHVLGELRGAWDDVALVVDAARLAVED